MKGRELARESLYDPDEGEDDEEDLDESDSDVPSEDVDGGE